MARTREKILAIQMRRSGNSYSDIRRKIPRLSKSTLSNWLRDLELSTEEKILVNQASQIGRDRSRLAAAKTNRFARLERTKKSESLAESQFIDFMKHPLFITGLSLYWAEGAKKSSGAEIINSDYRILKIAILWTESFLGINRNELKTRLYIHRQYAHENLEAYWIKILGLKPEQLKQTIFKKTEFEFKKNQDYKGCLRIHLGGVDALRKIFQWQKMLAQYLKVK
jgi:hypothetical protein